MTPADRIKALAEKLAKSRSVALSFYDGATDETIHKAIRMDERISALAWCADAIQKGVGWGALSLKEEQLEKELAELFEREGV